MDTKQSLPLSLKIVAWLLILDGIFAAIEIIVAMLHNRVSLNFGVLSFFIGRGLLQRRPGWRSCALVLTWFALLVFPIALLLILSWGGTPEVKIFGEVVGHTSTGIAFVVGVLGLLYLVWQAMVLMREDVRRLFN